MNKEIPYIDNTSLGDKVKLGWKASWIWEKKLRKNSFVMFRKQFTLRKKQEGVFADIAADSKYWLWINEKLCVFDGGLKRGPTNNGTYFDRVDISDYLTAGENTIAVLVWYFGKDGFSHIDSGKGGFLFESDMHELIIKSDNTFKEKRANAYKNDFWRIKSQPNYRLPESNIYYAARQGIEDFYKKDFDDSKWQNANEFGIPPVSPWNKLYLRSIPLLKYDKEYTNFENSGGYEGITLDKKTTIMLKLPYNTQFTPYFAYEAKAGKKIKYYTDNYKNDWTKNFSNIYITKKGSQEFESLSWQAGEALLVEIPAGVKIIALKYRKSGYDTEVSGKFISNDEFLNKLWDKSLKTLLITMRDSYMDCPERERGQWLGDIINEMEMAFYSLDENSYLLALKAFEVLEGFRRVNGVFLTVAPDKTSCFELPMQNLAGINGFWTYYLYTGDKYVIDLTYEMAKSYLLLWKIGENGLVIHRDGQWNWPDWGENSDIPVMENCWYYMAVKSVYNMAIILRKQDDAKYFKDIMLKIESAFNNAYLKNGAYTSNKEKYDDRANALAVLSGLASKESFDGVKNILNTVYNSSPYMEKYVLEALCIMGAEKDAVIRMKKRYKEMTEFPYSTLWEYWNKAEGTLNHAWSGGPLIIMSKFLAGIKPQSEGYITYNIAPVFVDGLETVECKVQTVKGNIELFSKLDRNQNELAMNVTTLKKAQGILRIPKLNSEAIYINGNLYQEGITKEINLQSDKEYVYLTVNGFKYGIGIQDKKMDILITV